MTDYTELKALTGGVYDMQKLRIQTGNRLCAEIRRKMGQEPGQATEALDDEEAKKMLKMIAKEYKLITEGLIHLPSPKKFESRSLIGTYAQLVLTDSYMRLLNEELRAFRGLEKVLAPIPVWDQWLKNVKGIGPAMGAVIISGFDIHKAKYASSLWRYAGVDVHSSGKGRGRYKEMMGTTTYTDADGDEQTKKTLGYNPWLKTKLVGVASACFLRSGGPYKDIYDNYKHRLQHNPKHVDKTEGHRHRMALRYMIKMFLVDLYANWREIEGLTVHPPYHEAKLGLRHAS